MAIEKVYRAKLRGVRAACHLVFQKEVFNPLFEYAISSRKSQHHKHLNSINEHRKFKLITGDQISMFNHHSNQTTLMNEPSETINE